MPVKASMAVDVFDIDEETAADMQCYCYSYCSYSKAYDKAIVDRTMLVLADCMVM